MKLNSFVSANSLLGVAIIITMAAFGYSSGNTIPAFISIGTAALLIIITAIRNQDIISLIGFHKKGNSSILWLFIGITVGVLIGVFYRFLYSESLFPITLGVVAVIGPIIGMTEELVYRGFIQGLYLKFHPAVGIIIASVGHATYKGLLLASSSLGIFINIKSLILFTFLVGCLFGYIRFRSQQVYGAMLAHAAFDIIVYGDQLNFPAWIW